MNQVQFLYMMENLTLYTPDIIHAIIALILSLIFIVGLWFVCLYSSGYVLLWLEKRSIENKKNILADLILMKDIQTEMEKEIEQATLKATFQG